MASRVAANSLVSWTFAPAMAAPGDHPRLPPRRSASPLFPAVGGITAYQIAPHPRFAHDGVGRLPLPVAPAQISTRLHQHGPHAPQDTALAPVLEMPVHGAVVAKHRRQLIPLAAGAQAEDDAIQHRTQVDAPMPLGFGGIALAQDWLDERPYVVRNFPNRGLRFGVHDNPPQLFRVTQESYRRVERFD
jgi:hypothetical protein